MSDLQPLESTSNPEDISASREEDADDHSQDAGTPRPDPSDPGAITLDVLFKGQKHPYTFRAEAILLDLVTYISTDLGILPENQKYLVSPKPGLLKPPFTSSSAPGNIPIAEIANRKITLVGSTPSEISSLNSRVKSERAVAERRQQIREGKGPVKPAAPSRTRDWKTLHDATTYTFLQLRPLPYLPNPERSLRFLERLRDDAGIKAVMAKHQWSVPLLTEMNPAEHTTQESRTLGLNRNAGEVIELRLRTDAYDGYRDYKTIRKTLCHELTHNVHGDHDRNFWDLCHQVEREVEKADWRHGGQSLSGDEFYRPQGLSGDPEDAVFDHGGWSGGEYVLGSGGSSSKTSGAPAGGDSSTMSRREILAKAAEERLKKQKEQTQEDPQSRNPE